MVDNADGYIKVIVNVDDEPSRNSFRKLSLDTYSQKPFEEGILHVLFFHQVNLFEEAP